MMSWLANLVDSQLFSWVVVPLLIFCARIMDVTLMTVRIITLSRGRKWLAPAFGFVEVLIWLIAIRQIMQNLDNPVSYLAYAAGFAVGNVVGIYLEDKLAIGTLIVRIITVKEAEALVDALRHGGYGVTSLDAEGATGRVKLIYTVVKRKDLHDVTATIRTFNPKAFVSVEEIQSASEGIFPSHRSRNHRYFGTLDFGSKRH